MVWQARVDYALHHLEAGSLEQVEKLEAWSRLNLNFTHEDRLSSRLPSDMPPDLCVLSRLAKLPNAHGKVNNGTLTAVIWQRNLHVNDRRNTLSAIWTPTQSQSQSNKKSHEPEDAHDLLLRAGFLRQAQPGIFHTLALGLRVLNKIESLIDKHMQSLGASKLSLSSLSAHHLWQKSGRLHARDAELFQLHDRRGTPLLLAPTHEEEITHMVKNAVHSYKHLPLRLYQVTRKYRDEARPRHGLLRGREFIMKDLYTFDLTTEQAMETYDAVQKAYTAFLHELNLPYLVAAADSGNMGGSHSHEYHFASPRGEDTVIKCGACSWSINEELYVGKYDATDKDLAHQIDGALSRCATWAVRTVRELEPKLKKPQSEKAIEQFVDEHGQAWVEYEKEYEEKAQEWDEDDRTERIIKVYYPRGTNLNIHAIRRLYPNLDTSNFHNDEWLQMPDDEIVHLRDPRVPESYLEGGLVASDELDIVEAPHLLTKARENDECPACGAKALKLHNAIEIGHTFHLGTRYSKPLEATVHNDSNELVNIQMGCHGIGVSRLVGAMATMLADAKGLNWPLAVAPFSMVLVGTSSASENDVAEVYDYTTNCLKRAASREAFDAVIDDRERPLGWKLNDADLIGYPFILVLGKAWKERKAVELQVRRLGIKEEVMVEQLPQRIASYSQKL